MPTHYVHHFINTKDYIEDDKITIISYDLLVRAVDVLKKHIYGFVILVHIYIIFNKPERNITVATTFCEHCRMNLMF